MVTRGWGKARKMAEGGFIDPAPTTGKETAAKPEFTYQRINRSKIHHTPLNAVNTPHTLRKPWQKLE